MKLKKVTAGVLTAVMLCSSTFPVLADSPVIGPGISGSSSQNTGPGAIGPGVPVEPSEPVSLPDIPGRVDYFTEEVPSPVVTVVEKYSYEQMCQDIQNLSVRYGSKLQTHVLGTSADGRNIYELVVGNPNAERHVLIHAGIHAREYMTSLLVMKQLEYGLEFYDRGSYDGQPLSNILDHVAVHYVPMVNPDGIALSQFGIGAIRTAQLRQTIQDCYANDVANGRTSQPFETYLTLWKANARGVDLNANFPAGREYLTGALYTSYANYRGPEPLSEPETQILANLTNSRGWSATVSYHSMGEVIYWDYAGNQQYEPSNGLANLIAASTGYGLAGSSGHGGYKDWAQIKDNAIASVTVETGNVACPLPLSQYERIWYQNKMVWAAVAKYVMEY